MYYSTKSTTVNGIDYTPINVEVTINNGIPNMRIVGLSDRSIQESKERIICAFRNSGIQVPAKKIRVNLAPSEIYKSGTGTDLAIACGILGCQNFFGNSEIFAFGELNMNGEVNLAKGAFQFLQYVKSKLADTKEMTIYFPLQGKFMLEFFPEINIRLCKSLRDITEGKYIESQYATQNNTNLSSAERHKNNYSVLSDICRNEKTKRALQISAAGHHHILLAGPVGTGKSIIARSLIDLLPEVSTDEKLEIIKVQNLRTVDTQGLGLIKVQRPFREVSRNTTITALTGTESTPGEFALANKGILLFDELAEASPKIINQLREPLEQKYIVINRARNKVVYPTDFIFVGTTNLCPCGKLGSKYNECKCSISERNRYIQKISHAVLNRIDLFCQLNEVNLNDVSLLRDSNSIKAEEVKIENSIKLATEVQHYRFKEEAFAYNCQIPFEKFDKYCVLHVDASKTINEAIDKLHLNGRDYVKTIRIARTIADFEKKDMIFENHILEALSYRNYLFEN